MRRTNLWLLAALMLLATAEVMAASAPVPFSDPVFARAQADGRIVVVETYASWCLPCRIQSPILERLRSQEQFKDVVILRIGEKSPNAAWKRFRLHEYGNLVVFKDLRETGRGTPTTELAIVDLVRTAQ
jgi:thioredoxin 1